MKIKYLLASLLATSLTFAWGCQPRDPEAPGEEPAAVDDRPTATIQGRLEAELGPVANATMVVQRVEANGALQNITIGDFRSDAQGNYEVTIDVTGGPLWDLIVEARGPQTAPPTAEQPEGVEDVAAMRLGRVILVRQINEGDSVTVAPMDLETTLESDIYIQARSAGEWDDRCDTAVLRAVISPQLAAAVRMGEQYEQDVEALARATTGSMKAYVSTLMRDPGFEGQPQDQPALEGEPFNTFSENDMQNARNELRNAIQDLDQRLHDTTEIEERMEAQRDFHTTLVEAYSNNNITIHQQARATHASVEAAVVFMPVLASAAQASAMATAEYHRAFVVTRVIESNVDTLGVSGENLGSVEQAGLSLKNTLLSYGGGQGDISDQVNTAWANYRLAVETQLQVTLDETQRAAYAEMHDVVVQPRTQMFNVVEGLSPETSSTAAANASSEAVPSYYNNVVSQQNISSLEQADISQDNARAILDTLFNFSVVTVEQ
ncbi:MAG: hypothetical protein H0U74_07345 [Bradymonadaceae bacterium]|nr:hypothetical protein [Lujinxingiaceae bacterium]